MGPATRAKVSWQQGLLHSAWERYPPMGHQQSSADHEFDASGSSGGERDAEKHKLKRKEYEKELRKLQTELCSLQDWVKATGERIIVIFEGRDAAGKGGTIRAMTERVSPAHLSDRRAASTNRSREVANVRTAVYSSLPGGRGNRDLRSELVQPGRRGTCHGVLH